MRPKVLYTYPAKEMDRVKELAEVTVLAEEGKVDIEEFKKEIKDAVALGNVRATHTPKEVIEAAENLKIITRHGVGYDCVDVEAATENNVIVSHALPYPYTVAEHTVGFLVALARKFVPATSSVKSKKWEVSKMSGFELRNKTLGVIGLGEIGAKVAEMVKEIFDMKILSPKGHSEENAKRVGSTRVEMKELLSKSDFISIHAPLTKETEGLIGKKELDMMKDGVYIVNCGRGKIIDQQALADAVKSGKVAGAALDTFVEEPPQKDNPLFELDNTENVIFTPHVAGVTHESTVRLGSSVAEDIVAILEGRLPNEEKVVNKEVLEAYK